MKGTPSPGLHRGLLSRGLLSSSLLMLAFVLVPGSALFVAYVRAHEAGLKRPVTVGIAAAALILAFLFFSLGLVY